MADSENLTTVVNGVDEVREKSLMEGMAVLDVDMLCATVALQAEGKGGKLEQADEDGGEIGGVQRLWEGEVLDCFEDHRIALETACYPHYRFGKNMRRAGFGSCFIQGTVYFIVAVTALLNYIAFTVSKQHRFVYLAVAFTILAGTYLGFFRTWIRKKFNIRHKEEIKKVEKNIIEDSRSRISRGENERNTKEVRDSGSVMKKSSSVPAFKRPRIETPSPLPTFKVQKVKSGDRITALHQLVSPFGKTDTTSVLLETIEFIKFLHEQVSVLSTPYMKNGAPIQHQQNSDKLKDPKGHKQDLRSRGLCLVPVSNIFPVTNEILGRQHLEELSGKGKKLPSFLEPILFNYYDLKPKTGWE